MSTTTTKNDKLAEAHERLAAAVESLVTGDDWRAALKTAAALRRNRPLSWNNTMMVLFQMPTAVAVKGYKDWAAAGRQVRKGEKGLAIFAPSSRKTVEVDADGNENERRWTTFRVVYVFDVSQTDGPELVEAPRPVLLDGEAPEGLWDALAAIVGVHGFSLSRGDCGGANGSTNFGTREVRVRDDVSDAQACKTLIHEIAHILLHGAVDYRGCRGRWEVEAESVAFVVADSLGMSTDGYSLPYVAGWSEGSAEMVREVGERVLKAADEILAAVDGVGANSPLTPDPVSV